jgi:alkanesulfonate monooxygenase SsuD/methylene tetrahydromethanopterin reductase-like flavin-dependent oxidoreductase (luciferase family)
MGEPLAEEYKRCLDPFVALTMAAAVTTDLVVGTGVALLAERSRS